MTNGLLDGFTSHWLRRESSHENRREKNPQALCGCRSVPRIWSGKREQIPLDYKGAGSQQNPAEGEVFLLTSPLMELCRTKNLEAIGSDTSWDGRFGELCDPLGLQRSPQSHLATGFRWRASLIGDGSFNLRFAHKSVEKVPLVIQGSLLP
jgi:hypothetical protein